MNLAMLIWSLLSFILGVCGNVFVLYATIIYNAIKLDKMSIWIIKNLAVVDLCNCVFVVVPAIAVLYCEGKWVFGPAMCYAFAIYVFTFVVANAFLINLLSNSINKLMRCVYPLRNFNCSRRQRILVSLSTVIFSLSIIISHIILLSNSKFYVLTKGYKITPLKTCFAEFPKTPYLNVSVLIGLTISLIYDGVPCITLVLTTTILLIYAIKKTNRPINKLNVFMVILVTASFLISFLPVVIHTIAHLLSTISKEQLDKIFEWAWSSTFVSSWINPIIYLAMNQSFRDFTRTLF